MGWASLENHAHAQLSQTPGLGGLGLCVEPGAGRACQASLGAGPGHAGRWGDCRGWLLVVECSRPRGSLHSMAWVGRILGPWPHLLSSLSRPGFWRGHRAVDGEENPRVRDGRDAQDPRVFSPSCTPWGLLGVFSLASSTCCFISGPGPASPDLLAPAGPRAPAVSECELLPCGLESFLTLLWGLGCPHCSPKACLLPHGCLASAPCPGEAGQMLDLQHWQAGQAGNRRLDPFLSWPHLLASQAVVGARLLVAS